MKRLICEGMKVIGWPRDSGSIGCMTCKIHQRREDTMARKILGITMFWMVVSLTIPPLSFPTDPCTQAKNDFVSAEKEWSSVNADITFLRDELEKLRSLRWETKTTLSVIEDASKILGKNSSLKDAQRMTLNARIPSGRGTIDPKGMFAMTGAEGKPLKLDEARDMLRRVLKEAESDIAKTEKELTEMEKKSHRLSQELNAQEQAVEKKCKAAGLPTPWEQGLPRVSSAEVYDRYVERERMREEAVAQRRYSDIERLWARRYYGYPSSYALASAQGLLIELRGVDGGRTFRHCYPFRDPREKQLVLDELDRAAREHQNFFEVGRLGSYRVINVCPDIHDCYRRLSP
jgi:hypothetical protein